MINLKGLSSASPICAMAAMGLLRVLSEDRGHAVRLGWRDGHAVLDGVAAETCLEELTLAMRDRAAAPEFTWADSAKKVSPATYRKHCERMTGDRRALAFMAAWGSDTVVQNGGISTSQLDLTSGQQKLIRLLRELAKKLEKPKTACSAFRSALFGGPYEIQNSFGWDPTTVRQHAHEHNAPTKTKPPGKRGLVWLAAEALPLHPVIPVSASRCHTVGCDGSGAYVWPAWDALLCLDEVRLLRSIPCDRLAIRPGVTEVWRSKFGKSGKAGILYPALRER